MPPSCSCSATGNCTQTKASAALPSSRLTDDSPHPPHPTPPTHYLCLTPIHSCRQKQALNLVDRLPPRRDPRSAKGPKPGQVPEHNHTLNLHGQAERPPHLCTPCRPARPPAWGRHRRCRLLPCRGNPQTAQRQQPPPLPPSLAPHPTPRRRQAKLLRPSTCPWPCCLR